jgi:hypothetical protein
MVFSGGAQRGGVAVVRRRRGFGAMVFSGEVVQKVASGMLRGALQHRRVAWGMERKVIEQRCLEVDAHRWIAVAAQNIGGGWGRS